MKPSARASFFGRATELDHLARLLAEPQALVSLTGPPGSGKSRLAREHVAAVAQGFAGGVHWVDLAEARSVEEMCAAVAHAMGERLATGTSSEELVERLAQGIAARGEALIVLDDLEHLAELAPATIDVWRAHADASAFLVTSRERLRLAGERRIDIGPLPVPDERERDPESIARFDSVRLFVDRARAVRAGWTPSAEELFDAAALVRALDGIPLAIELCAARAAMLGTRQIRERLPAVLDLLAHGARGAAARSATVRGAIDCSWQLLDEGEQRAFAQCAVFRGGFTLEAAEQVLGTDALERLQALVDKSLLHVREVDGLPGELRFGMYEPLARYAAEQLDKTELRPDAEAKHARWFAEAGSRWAAAVDDASGGKMFRRLGCEAANLSAALARTMSAASEPERAERALRLTLALEPLLRSRGPIAELERRLDEALEAATEAAVPPALLARGMVARGLARYIGGDPTRSVEELEAAAAAASSCGALDLEALARVYLGVAAASVGKLAAARRELESAGTLAEQANVPRVDALARTHRARWVLARQGRSDEARRELERALELLQRTGATRDEGRVHAYLGHLFLELGALDDAGAHYQRATALLRDLGDARLEAELRVGLAVVEQELGRRAEAHGQLEEAKVMFEVIGVDAYRGILELHLGALALEDERRGEAVEHYARAAVLLEGHWAGGLSSVAMAGRAVAELLSGEAAAAGPRIQEARAAAKAASPAIARSVEMLACAFDLWAGQPRASARAEELEAEDAASKPAYREPWQEEVRVARFARRLLASARASGQAAQGPASSKPKRRLAWLVRDDGRAFRRPDGPPVSLERRGTLSRILRALAERHATSPGQALDVYELGEAGWPGQRIGTEAAANRVRVALTTLRKLGLRDLLVSRDDGYLLDPKARVALVTDMNRPP